MSRLTGDRSMNNTILPFSSIMSGSKVNRDVIVLTPTVECRSISSPAAQSVRSPIFVVSCFADAPPMGHNDYEESYWQDKILYDTLKMSGAFEDDEMPQIEPPPSIADLPKAYMMDVKHWMHNRWVATQRSKDPDDPRSMTTCDGCELCIIKAGEGFNAAQQLSSQHDTPQKVGKKGRADQSSHIFFPTPPRTLKPSLTRSARLPRQVRPLAGIRATTQTGQPFEFYLDAVNMASETGYIGLQYEISDAADFEKSNMMVNTPSAVREVYLCSR